MQFCDLLIVAPHTYPVYMWYSVKCLSSFQWSKLNCENGKLEAFYIRWTSPFPSTIQDYSFWAMVLFVIEFSIWYRVLFPLFVSLSSFIFIAGKFTDFYCLLWFLLSACFFFAAVQFILFQTIFIFIDESIEHIMHWIPPSIRPCMCLCVCENKMNI